MSITLRILIGCLALVPFASTALAQKPIPLKYKFSSTHSLTYRVVDSMQQTKEVKGKQDQYASRITEVIQYRLNRVDKNRDFELDRENKTLQANIQIAELGDYKFDSRSDENERGSTLGSALTPVFETLSRSTYKVAVNPRGKVTGVSGFKNLLAPVIRDKPLAGRLAYGGTDAGAAAEIAPQFVEFSDKPVKPGDTWLIPMQMTVENVGTFEGKKTYKLVGMETYKKRTVARITYTTELTIDIKLSRGGAKLTGKIQVDSSKGTALFDPAKGQLVQLNEELVLKGRFAATTKDSTIEATTQQTQTTSVELLDKLPN